jgi:hypothetical protein
MVKLKKNSAKILCVLGFILFYFTIWRWIRVLIISFIFLPTSENLIHEYQSNVYVSEGNSSVNVRIVRMDIYRQMLNRQIITESSSAPVQTQGVTSGSTKYEFYLKAPGDIWFLMGGVGLLLLSAKFLYLYYLWGSHVLASLLSFFMLIVAILGWSPGLYMMNMISSFIIPSFSMMFIVLLMNIQRGKG